MTYLIEAQNRWWVLHEEQLCDALVRCYNQELTPMDMMALFTEHANNGDEDGEE